MSNPYEKRILREISDAMKSDLFKCIYDEEGLYDTNAKNTLYLKFTIQDGYYKDQIHILQVKFVYGAGNTIYHFPIYAPNILFMTPILHVNIATGGSICLDVLKDKWSQLYNITTIFNSIIALLNDPNASSPFNSGAIIKSKNHKEITEDFTSRCNKYYQENMIKFRENPRLSLLMDAFPK